MAQFSINLKEGVVDNQGEIIVGIDLGTTNSIVAYMKNGEPEAVRDESGKHTLVPSVIHFNANKSVLVGDQAREKLITDPENTIYSVKRLMGKSYEDIESVDAYFGYKILDEDTDSLVKIQVHDKFYTPIELSSEILKHLKERIEKRLSTIVTKAVITVPAYFNDAQRQATRDAGKLAGLDVLRIVNEPTAASLAYGIGRTHTSSEKVAVYDLGGGTFDVSILDIQDGVFEVLSTNGDTFLGGDDFDRAIIEHWLQELNWSPETLKSDKSKSQRIRLLAEEAKKTLTDNDLFAGQIDQENIQLDYETFKAISKPLIDKTLASCKQALLDADLTIQQINEVILVGGSTRMRPVKEAVEAFFQKKPHDNLNPDEVVALGAAVQADILAGNQADMLLIDVTPLSLGIETVGGLMDVIIPRNNKVPSRVGRNYTTSVDGQKNLKVSVFQGERDLVAHNRKLGEFILKGIPPMPAGIPKIEIQFMLDADGILKVKAKELRSGVEQEIEIRSQYGISEEEMALMLIDSLQNAEADMAKRGLLEAVNEANNIILSAKKFIEQNHAILSKEEVEKTIALTQHLEDSVKGDDKDLINTRMAELNDYTAPLAHRAMDVNIADAIKGKKL